LNRLCACVTILQGLLLISRTFHWLFDARQIRRDFGPSEPFPSPINQEPKP